MKVAAAYILTCPQWFNTLNQPIMLCIFVKDWESAALFQYFPDMLEWNKPGYLPKWRIFCQDRRDLPNNAIHWREPSTVWKAWRMIGFMSETDFLEKNAQHLPQEVGFRNFPPMWSFPPPTIHNNTENITFGMDLTHIDEQQTEKDAIQAQCPIVCFKASTVMQSMTRRKVRPDVLPQYVPICIWIRHTRQVQRHLCSM